MSEAPLTSDGIVEELRNWAKECRTRDVKLRGYDGATAGLCDRAAEEIEGLLCEIGAHHSALLKIENEVRGISTAERKSYLLTVIGRVREWAREAIHG